MIHIYRMTRYPDVDKIIFQGTDDTVKNFKLRFPLRVQPTKMGFEEGWFTWLRDDYREKFFAPIHSFFQAHYSPPEIRLSCFQSKNALSELWPKEVWRQKVSDAIQTLFSKNGYTAQPNPHGESVDVVPSKPSFQIENVEVYWAVGYWVEIGNDRKPVLWCYDRFLTLLDGRPASLEQIGRALGEDSHILQKIRHFTTRNAEEQFNILRRFVKHITPLTACENIAFSDEPVAAKDAGFETWFWLRDSDACFEVSNGLKTNLAQALLGEGCGLFVQPDDLLLIVILPDPQSSPLVPQIEWPRVLSDIDLFIRQTMPEVEVPMCSFQYPLSGDYGQCMKGVQEAVQKYPGRRVLCLMATPSPVDRRSARQDILAVEQQSRQINRELRAVFQEGYAETLDWNKLRTDKDRPYVIHNALLGSLYRLNAEPWKIADLPFTKEPASGNYFLGLYGSEDDRPALAGTLFGHEGGLVAFGGVYLDDPDAGTYEEELNRLIITLISKGIHQSKPKPVHLIIHMTPELQGYTPEIKAIVERLALTFDLLAIKHSSVHFLQPMNCQGTPSHGIAVGSDASKTAYMMNTLSVGEKTNDRGFIYPNPNTMAIQQLAGASSIKTLAAQIYWLSNGHISALHRTVDTPMTIAYTRALHDHIRKTKRSMRVTRNYRRTLFWL